MSIRRLLLAASLASSSFLSCAAPPRPDPPILVLDNQEVVRSEFEGHLQAMARRGHQIDADLRRALLQPFLEERILVLEARSRGLLKTPASEADERSAVELMLAGITSGPEISDKEVAEYYESHREAFRHPTRVTLHQILVPTENEARDVRRRLQRDPKSFEILARTQSRSPEASTGGLMGTFEPGQLPSELDAAVFSLPAGATSEVIHSPLGYHLLRVDALSPQGDDTLPECAPRIRATLRRARSDQAVRAFVQQLMSRAKVNYEIALRLDRRS